MRRLLLLRHAKAVPQDGMADEDRPLAERGRADMPAVARHLIDNALLPDFALVSPARRTRETFELLIEHAVAFPSHRYEPRLYAASMEALLRVIRETPPAVGSALIVGHNPGLEELARALVESGEADALMRLGAGMPTAGVAIIDLAVSDWARIERRSGRLVSFVTPKSLAAAR